MFGLGCFAGLQKGLAQQSCQAPRDLCDGCQRAAAPCQGASLSFPAALSVENGISLQSPLGTAFTGLSEAGSVDLNLAATQTLPELPEPYTAIVTLDLLHEGMLQVR